MKQADQRIEWIDNAKGIGLLLVILGHLKAPFLSAWIYTFHMPLFFFLSGVVFSSGKYKPRKFILKRINSLVVPYFVLGAVIFLFYVIVFLIQHQPTSEYLIMLKEFLLQRHYWTIWFLAALFFTEIIYFAIDYLLSDRIVPVTIVSILFAVIGFVYYRLDGKGLPWNIDIAFVAQLFFHMGHMFKRSRKYQDLLFFNYRWVCVSVLLLLITINIVCAKLCIKYSGQSIDMSIGLYGNEVLTVFSALAAILATCIISNKIHWDALSWLGKNTMVIFSWHSRIGIVALDFFCGWLGWFCLDTHFVQLARAIVYFSVLLIVFTLLTIAIKKTKYHRLFGL